MNIGALIETFTDKFTQNFIEEGRYMYLVEGLSNTLKITFFAVILGIIIGFIIAIIRSTHDMSGRIKSPFFRTILNVLNFICNIYLTVIRGTPVMIQILIIYFSIFGAVDIDKIFVAVIAFGLNSAAYVAEIFRSGIMSTDKGQFEAGRSLGFNYMQTMLYIIMPQAFKTVLPSLGNEFIVLLKETAVAGYIALQDLTKGADVIRSRTFSNFPLYGAAVIYLILVMIMTAGVNRLERRLRNSEH